MPDAGASSAQVDQDRFDANALFSIETQPLKSADGSCDPGPFSRIQGRHGPVFAQSARLHFDDDQFSCPSVLHEQIDFRAANVQIAAQQSISDRSQVSLRNPFGLDALPAIVLSSATVHVRSSHRPYRDLRHAPTALHKGHVSLSVRVAPAASG